MGTSIGIVYSAALASFKIDTLSNCTRLPPEQSTLAVRNTQNLDMLKGNIYIFVIVFLYIFQGQKNVEEIESL